MASLNVPTPDGKSLTVQVPAGTDPTKYGDLADDALAHYKYMNPGAEKPTDNGALASGAMAMGNNIPLFPQAASLGESMAGNGDYSSNLATWNQAMAQNKAQHPVAYGTGAVAGALAPMAIPGVGAAMKAAPALTGGALGAANAISNTDLKQNPGQAAGQAALGAGTGALLSSVLSKIMPSPDTLEAKANSLANKSVNMPAGVLVDMTPQEQQAQGQFLRDAGLVGQDKGKILGPARSIMKGYGEQIGSIGSDLEKQGLSIDDPNQLTQPLIEKFASLSQSANPEAKQLARTYLAGINDIENLAKPAIAESSAGPDLVGPTGQAIAKSPAPSEPITWSKLQDLKETYGSLAFKSTGEVKNQAAADVYFSLSNGLKDIADQASNNPAIPSSYKEALQGYSRMSPIVSGLEKSVDADLRGASGTSVGFHPMRMLGSMPGPVRAIGGAAALATGHPILAVAAGLPEAMNPAVQSNAAGLAAKAVPGIQEGLQNLATKYGSNPQTQQNLQSLIAKLKQQYDQRRQM